jgi:hypothetical protein
MNTESSTHDSTGMPQVRGYKLLRVIGHGGMSTVFLAEQQSLGRKVAIKVMLPEALTDEVSRRRFENEARTIARLDHPHIVGIHEVGRTVDGLPYYTMPCLARGHLAQRIARHGGHGLNEAWVVSVLRALLEALDYAHVRGVVHRDVKAENVLFDEAERPLLADFGIALRKGISPRVTTAGLAVGSTAYMPPEQARGEEVDTRADLYSIGVLAWEMLTGELPFNAGDALSMAVMHAQDPIPRLPPGLRHWQRFIDRSMAKLPGNRFRSAQQMLEALARLERGGFSTDALVGNTASLLGRARRIPRGGWIALGLVGAAAAGIALRDPDSGASGFFRIDAPAVAAPESTTVDDPIASMLRPPPESPAQPFINDVERQVATRNLTAPEGDNAYASLLAAWEADPDHAGMGGTVDLVIGALGKEMASRLRDGDGDRARDYFERARHLAETTAPLGTEALRALRGSAAEALEARIEASARRMARDDALAAAALVKEFTGDQALADGLRARAAAIAGDGDRIAGDPAGTVVVRGAGGAFAAMRREVTRAEYARFAAATNRPAARCRERLSLLRIVKPRSWREPGFDQADGQSVVCVSWADANAYAQWFSRTTGEEYRLPTAAEWRAIGEGSGGGRAVAEWVRERGIAGRSWRGAEAARNPDPARGYDDIGFRLVREL